MNNAIQQYSFLYSLGVAACAALITLLGVVLSGPSIGQNEQFISVGYIWLFSLPVIFVYALISGFSYKWYRSQDALIKIMGVFLLSSIVVGFLSFFTVWLIGARWYAT